MRLLHKGISSHTVVMRAGRNRISGLLRKTVAAFLLLAVSLLPTPTVSTAYASRYPVGPRLVRGWPVILGSGVDTRPSVADLDGDGSDELAVSVMDGRVFLLDGRGRSLPGWPQCTDNLIFWSPLLDDINDDGEFEIVAVSRDGYAHAWRTDGTRLPGWPVDMGDMPVSSAQLVRPRSGKEPSILVASSDGNVHLLYPNGDSRPGWPQYGGDQSSSPYDTFPVGSADLDGDGMPEILFLSGREAVLHAWDIDGTECPGFPQTLGNRGLGIAIDSESDSTRIACSTSREVVVLDAHGRHIMHLPSPRNDDVFYTAPCFMSSGSSSGKDCDLIGAATHGGAVCVWNREGVPLPGWPVQLGGFIFGIHREKEYFTVHYPPQAWDVDGDGVPEILEGSDDQHLYCFDLSGRPAPGWPLTLDDGIRGGLSFAQLDGVGRKELVVGQSGETLFAFHVDRPGQAQEAAVGSSADLFTSAEWPPAYFAVAGAVLLLLLLLTYRYFQANKTAGGGYRHGTGAKTVPAIIAVVLMARAVIFAGELRHYREAKHWLREAEASVQQVLADERSSANKMAGDLAAELRSREGLDLNDSIQLRYSLERIADQRRLDYEYTGIMLADGSGGVVQALGLARGWTHVDSLGLSIDRETGPIMLGETPVCVGESPIRLGQSSGRLYFFSSLLNTFPQSVGTATGVSVHLQLGGRTVAWAGTPPSRSSCTCPWIGIVEPTRSLVLSGDRAESALSIGLAVEDFTGTSTGWMDLIIVLLIPVLYFSISRRRQGDQRPILRWWWPLLVVIAYSAGVLLLSHGGVFRRPVPFAGHSLELLLHLLGLSALAVILSEVVGAGRVRRLSFTVLTSYLVVGILPLGLGILIAIVLLQQAQSQVLRDKVSDLEERADNMVMAYVGSMTFRGNLHKVVPQIMERPSETRWFDFVAEYHLLFTYDLPTAYLTLWGQDRTDPDKYFSGFSWRTPRTDKFFARRPEWTWGENQKGLFLDGAKCTVRAMRTLRTTRYEINMVSHVPVDRAIVNNLEEHLRILPILPRVRLEPAWLAATDDTDQPPGLRLPFMTKLVLPARDWNTGAPRWVVYHASAFLPAGREMWTVLAAMVLLAMLPLALSFWGAYSTYQRTVRPLTRLLTGIKRVETGDLEYRLGDTGHTEIASAARAFDRMADSLERNVRELAEKKKVEEVSELKSYFLSMVGHDLKTPLASIKGAAENVLTELAGPVTDRQRAYLEMILSSTDNLQKIIADLLDLSQIESGHLTLQMETLDMTREAENVLRSVRPLLDERSLEARISATSSETKVLADRTRLWQIVNNLVSNAVRYSPDGGRIDVLIEDGAGPASGEGGLLRVTVRDQGPGVPEEGVSRLFEPFYARPAGPKGKHGAGLGLAIVKNLVELHGGKVSYESSQDGGASFSFTLPKA